jgi:mannan endo-1,4-beta-mannosidase
MKLLPCLLLGLPLAAAGAAPASSGFEHYITRRGTALHDGDQVFRFLGANLPGLVLPYDYTLFLSERLALPTAWEQEDGFKTLDQMGFRVVRTWNLPIRKPQEPPRDWHYVLGPGKFNEEAFRTIDRLFALANRYRVRVIFDFSAEYGSYLGGIQTYAEHRGRKAAEFFKDPQLKEDYKATLRHVLGRTNTITGVPYREEKAVLAWQFGNEMVNAPDAWLTEMAAFLKSLAPHHLVAETRHRPGQPLLVDPNIDLLTRHLYANYKGVEGGWPGAIRAEMTKLNGQRPLFIGEFGPYIDGRMFTPENVVGKLREFLDYVQSDPAISGALLWSMYFHHARGGYYWHQIFTYPAVWAYHWPGFPSAEAQREIGVLQAMREAAFRIQGKPVPPLPVPEAPALLPFADVPLFSWRGSAGASGYDIERAPRADGPWTILAANISDADIAYRPLFSDPTARAGDRWFYRVKARNASGISPPSNTVGPVVVQRVCLVDELQDLSRAHATSGGLQMNNDYNALYAEHLFRARGAAREWIVHRAPGTISAIKVIGFTGEAGGDLTLETSADGTTFAALTATRSARALPPITSGAAAGQRRTMITWEGTPAAGQRFLRLNFTGPAELDRVEIYHDGR